MTECADGHGHCWHPTGTMFPTRPPKVEEVCCWCGRRRTRGIETRGSSNASHGPHDPHVKMGVDGLDPVLADEPRAVAPERIYLQVSSGDDWTWCRHPAGDPDVIDVEYIRVDACLDTLERIRELEGMWDTAWEQALRLLSILSGSEGGTSENGTIESMQGIPRREWRRLYEGDFDNE